MKESQMQNNRVSVVVPLYNYRHYIQENIQSIVKQTYTDWEIIIVDDASKDNPYPVIKPYLNKNIKYMRMPSNRGYSAAKNVGIRASSGNFLVILDADDMLTKKSLKWRVDYILEHDVSWVHGKALEFHDRKPYESHVSVIVSPTTSIDHIDISEHKIKIIHLLSDEIYHIKASSEFVVFLIFCLLRNVHEIITNSSQVTGEDLHGKKVGILGGGRIGYTLSSYLKSFGCEVLIYDTISSRSTANKNDVLSLSDIVIVAISAIKDNHSFMGHNEFKMMKQDSYFINVSRSFIVDDVALLHFLRAGKFKGVALDVIKNNSCLLEYEGSNLLITPHVAGCTKQSRKKASEFVLDKLFLYLGESYEKYRNLY